MTVTKWTNTLIKGHVQITDKSNVMMTSIPYNPGWTVKVDGKKSRLMRLGEVYYPFQLQVANIVLKCPLCLKVLLWELLFQ